jgi:hypothetical protein
VSFSEVTTQVSEFAFWPLFLDIPTENFLKSTMLGSDFHTRYQQIAMLDEKTGELIERRLEWAKREHFMPVLYAT